MSVSNDSSPMGPIIHNIALQTQDLPAHADIPNDNAGTPSRPSLQQFITATLLEGDAFINQIPWSNIDKAKPSPPSTARVQIGKFSADLGRAGFGGSFLASRAKLPSSGSEYWYGRRSEHENAELQGTASFAELDDGLRQDHSPKEADYTPDIFDCVTVLDYSSAIAALDFGGLILKPDLKVYEMAHDLGAMLTPRVFAIAVVSGQLEAGKRFVVVQLPVDLSAFAPAMYSNGRNVREAELEKGNGDGKSKVKGKKCLVGSYASIERGINHGEKTEWSMVTASNAGGALPLWLQNKVAPGKVVHDVGLFMKWQHGRRAGSAGGSVSGSVAGAAPAATS